MNYTDENGLVSPFYRVALRAVIRDEKQRVLVLKNYKGTYELPGGGWEHQESYEECLEREISEELGVDVASIGEPVFIYRGRSLRWGHPMLRIVVPVTLKSRKFRLGHDMRDSEFVSSEKFASLDWSHEDLELPYRVDKLWPKEDNLKNE